MVARVHVAVSNDLARTLGTRTVIVVRIVHDHVVYKIHQEDRVRGKQGDSLEGVVAVLSELLVTVTGQIRNSASKGNWMVYMIENNRRVSKN